MLVRLDPKAVFGELNQMEANLASQQVSEIRLRAFLTGKKPDYRGISSDFASLIQDHDKLLATQRSAWKSRRQVSQTKISRHRGEIQNLVAQLKPLQYKIRLLTRKLAVTEKGFARGLVSRIEVMNANQTRSDAESELLRTQGQLSILRKQLQETLDDLAKQDDERREKTMDELGRVTAERVRAEKAIARLRDRAARLEIRAPVHGMIKNMPVKTVRGVLPPGGLVAEIVPMAATRYVETRISTRDVGHVNIGQLTTVKVTTFDFARYGGINGTLESISPATFDDPRGGEPYYKGIIRLDKHYLGNNPKLNAILPGMTIQANIHTGSKTLMEYMLKPIFSSVNKSFRER